jgi:nucleotide-binding universal stress UspA family protein
MIPLRFASRRSWKMEKSKNLEHDAEVHAATESFQTAIERIEPVGDVGDPAQCILDEAHARHVDLIVIGYHSTPGCTASAPPPSRAP